MFESKIPSHNSQVSSPKQSTTSINNQNNEFILANNQNKYEPNRTSHQYEKSRITSFNSSIEKKSRVELHPEVFHLLNNLCNESGKNLAENCAQIISGLKQKVERKVYVREMSESHQQYFEEFLIESTNANEFIRFGLADLIEKANEQVCEDILYSDKYKIHKKSTISKDEIVFIEKSMSKIKDNQFNIKDKVGEMKIELQNEANRIHEKSLQIVNAEIFSIKHTKTKEVGEFLKDIQLERAQRKDRKQKMEEKMKLEDQMKNEIEEQEKEKAKTERHSKLLSEFELKRKMKEKEMNDAAEKNKEFQKWMKEYNKKVPLFKEKEKEFEQKFAQEEQEERLNKLRERKELYGSMKFEDLESHEEKYLEYRRDFNVSHNAEVVVKKEEEKRRKDYLEKLHKGKSRYFILKELVEQKEKQETDDREKQIQKRLREQAYSQNVKEYHAPTVDLTKKMQIENLIQSTNKKRRHTGPHRVTSISVLESGRYGETSEDERDPKKEGEKHRMFMKQFVKERIERGQVRKSEKIPIQTLEPKSDYLREKREKRGNKSVNLEREIMKLKEAKDVPALLVKINQHDSKTERLEKQIKYSEHRSKEEAKLEDDYLDSIKAKIELLQRLK